MRRELVDRQSVPGGASQNGNSRYWTDAIFRLADCVRDRKGKRFEIVDWGHANSLILLTEGHVTLDDRAGCLAESSSPSDSDCGIAELLIRPGVLYIQHTRDKEIFPNNNEHLERIAAAHGVREELDQVIADAHSRPMFEIIHFVPSVSESKK